MLIRDIIDGGLNLLTKIVYETLTASPGVNTLGRFWFRSDTKRVAYYDGSIVRAHATIDDTLSTFGGPTADIAMSGHNFTGARDPVAPQELATKAYADGIAAGFSPRNSVLYMAEAALPAYVYANGASGVGATITASANGIWTVGGQLLTVGDRVLVPDTIPVVGAIAQAASDAGLYTVTTVGTAGVKTVLTRATDFNSVANMKSGDFVFVELGIAQKGAAWIMNQNAAITVGTTAITWTQFSAAATIAAGNGVEVSGSTVTATPPIYRPARVVVTSNIASLSAPGATIDGVSMAAGDRVLLTAQTSGAQNGPWIWNGAAVAMTRPADYAAADTKMAMQGAQIEVFAGTAGIGSEWYITTTGAITIDTTVTAWAQMSVNLSGAGVSGGPLAIASGGTGGATAAAARAALGIVSKFVANIGDGATNPIPVTHGLGTLDIQVTIIEIATGAVVLTTWVATSTTVVTVTFSTIATTAQYRIIATG